MYLGGINMRVLFREHFRRACASEKSDVQQSLFGYR